MQATLSLGKMPSPQEQDRRKAVRFADVLGLELAKIRHFLIDETPRIPRSAFKDLKDANFGLDHLKTTPRPTSTASSSSSPSLTPCFAQPGAAHNFMAQLAERKVLLEGAFAMGAGCVRGNVRVRNMGFEKRVSVRYSLDGWASSRDVDAVYVLSSADGSVDTFAFMLYPPAEAMRAGQSLQFCVRYTTAYGEFWDSGEGGRNYVFVYGPETTNAVKEDSVVNSWSTQLASSSSPVFSEVATPRYL